MDVSFRRAYSGRVTYLWELSISCGLMPLGKLGEPAKFLKTLYISVQAVVDLGILLYDNDLWDDNSFACEISRLEPGGDSVVDCHTCIWY